jgi:hypothetical protein
VHDVDIATHVGGLLDGVYRAIGEAAPTLTKDAYVIRAYELGRAFGEEALRVRALIGDEPLAPSPLVENLLRHAATYDDSGALALFAMAMVVGPRLLISVRDAREAAGEALREVLDGTAQTIVKEIRRIGDVASTQAPIEDEAWQLAARDLTETLEAAGAGESFGFSR